MSFWLVNFFPLSEYKTLEIRKQNTLKLNKSLRSEIWNTEKILSCISITDFKIQVIKPSINCDSLDMFQGKFIKNMFPAIIQPGKYS